MDYPQIAQRIFNRPLLIEPRKAETILAVLAPRLGISRVRIPASAELGIDEERVLDVGDLEASLAETRRSQGFGRGGREEQRSFALIDGVAYIPVIGTLVQRLASLEPWSGMTGYNGLRRKLADAIAEPQAKAILFDIDSPGGEVAGLFDLVDEIRAARSEKPIWAVANEFAASAAYAIASSAEYVFLPRTAEVGSIGVITMHVDWSKALEAEGITVTLIFAGEHKADGNPFEPLPDPVRAEIQSAVERIRGLFAETVGLGRDQRGLSAKAARATEARIYMGEDAVSAGLADGVASMSQVFAALLEEIEKRPVQTAA